MDIKFIKEKRGLNWYYSLLLIPFISAILALLEFGFVFKSGTAGAGIVILLLVYRNQLTIRKDIFLVVAAFVFSIAGDWFLSNRSGNSDYFNYGIVLFLGAHIGYLWFALLNGKMKRLYTLLILAGYLMIFSITMYPHIHNGLLMVLVLLYLLISCFSLGASIGIRGVLGFKVSYIVGIALILFSDTLIALREFSGISGGDSLILPTYYLAHLSITASLTARHVMYEA